MTEFNYWRIIYPMNWEDRIVTNPKIMVGKPVVRGTRLTVEFILGRFADGWTERDVLESYPNLSPEDIRAVFAYAADCMNDGVAFSFPGVRQ